MYYVIKFLLPGLPAIRYIICKQDRVKEQFEIVRNFDPKADVSIEFITKGGAINYIGAEIFKEMIVVGKVKDFTIKDVCNE